MRALGWSLVVVLLLIATPVLLLMRLSHGVARNREEISALEAALKPQCTNAESVDRWLLQQSWFHDPGFAKLAAMFGQDTFSLHEEGDPAKSVEGAFCIDGKKLVVRYFQRDFVPISVRFPFRIEFGTRLEPLGEDSFVVQELTKERMTLMVASDRQEHVFYRKN